MFLFSSFFNVPRKKSERFLETMEYYQTFVDSYATSKYLKEAQGIFNNCIAKIEQLKKLSN